MKRPLSYSAYKRYTNCGQYYKYYDIDGIRPGKDSSALIMGTIVDNIVMDILQKVPVDVEMRTVKELDPYRKATIEFYTDDLDLDLINLDEITTLAESKGWKGDSIGDALKDMLKDQANISANQYEVLREAIFQAMEQKIIAMVESFNKWILPQITEVHDIQTHLDDGITHGYLDFTATMTGGKKVLFDLKTSKMPYAKDAVLKSPQLSLYAAMHGYEYAGFIVLVKNLNKNKVKTCSGCEYVVRGGNRVNCPECKERMSVTMEPTSYSQLLVDKVPQRNKDLTTQAMTDTIKAIDAGHFPRNLNTCFYMYGKPCPYVSKCWKGEDDV